MTKTTCTPADFYYSDYWGITEAPSTSPHSAGRIEEETGFLTALCNAAGGDGTASKVERDHIFGMASVKGYTPEAIAKIDDLADAAESKTIEEIASDAKMAMSIGTLRFAAGAILFESIKAASKDGLDEKEMEMIFCIAEIMEVSKERVQTMMEVVAEEEELKKKRIAACISNHPCLAPEYKD
eukprot:scaffold393_cov158-Skeletonema_dohrnii-CCMP3373.AAC.2